MSVAKVSGILYAALGLVAGLFLAAISTASGLAGMTAANRAGPFPALAGLFFGVGAIVFLPILYGIMGFVGGGIAAALYNVFAGLVGGVELEIEGAA
jgi:hypothetical protein